MKRNGMLRWTAVMLALLTALALCTGCGSDDKYDSVNASVSASADKSALTLYEDDTLVAYTVTTPKQCTRVILQRVDPRDGETALSEQLFERESEGVVTAVEGDTRVWTIPCDFGRVGVSGVRVKAQVPMGKVYDVLYADVPLTVAYPVHTISDLDTAFYRCALLDEPYLFTCAQDDAALLDAAALLFGDDRYARMAEAGTAVLGGNFLYGDATLCALGPDDTADIPAPDGQTLCRLYIPNDAYATCRAEKGLMITDAARAAIAYQTGATVDEARFPVAALLLQKGADALSMLSLSGKDDLTVARAIYEWVYNTCRMGVLPEQIDALPEAEKAYYLSTAYGVLSGFTGDASGCADTYWLLMNMAGQKCAVLDCARADGETTRVNLVLLGGNWYVMDLYADGALSVFADGALFTHFGLNTADAGAYLTLPDGVPENTAASFAA